MKKIFVGAVIVAVAVVIWQVYPTEKRKLRNYIGYLERAVETEKTDEILSNIDPAYRDSNGMTYDEISRVITQFFLQVDSIKIQMSGLEVRIDSVAAEDVVFASCSLGLRVIGRYEGERVLVLGGIVKPSPVRAFFKKHGKLYRICGAEY
jgi:hypothetical protein